MLIKTLIQGFNSARSKGVLTPLVSLNAKLQEYCDPAFCPKFELIGEKLYFYPGHKLSLILLPSKSKPHLPENKPSNFLAILEDDKNGFYALFAGDLPEIREVIRVENGVFLKGVHFVNSKCNGEESSLEEIEKFLANLFTLKIKKPEEELKDEEKEERIKELIKYFDEKAEEFEKKKVLGSPQSEKQELTWKMIEKTEKEKNKELLIKPKKLGKNKTKCEVKIEPYLIDFSQLPEISQPHPMLPPDGGFIPIYGFKNAGKTTLRNYLAVEFRTANIPVVIVTNEQAPVIADLSLRLCYKEFLDLFKPPQFLIFEFLPSLNALLTYLRENHIKYDYLVVLHDTGALPEEFAKIFEKLPRIYDIQYPYLLYIDKILKENSICFIQFRHFTAKIEKIRLQRMGRYQAYSALEAAETGATSLKAIAFFIGIYHPLNFDDQNPIRILYAPTKFGVYEKAFKGVPIKSENGLEFYKLEPLESIPEDEELFSILNRKYGKEVCLFMLEHKSAFPIDIATKLGDKNLRKQVHKIMQALCELGYLTQKEKGSPYQLTPEGEKVIPLFLSS